MPSIDIDGPSKTITVGYDGPVTNTTAVEIYSAWKLWVKSGEANWDEAFAESVGGNDLGAGLSLDAYVFVRNDLGWTIMGTPGYSYEIRLIGNLYPFNPALPFLDAGAGGDTYAYILQRSSASYAVETGVSGLTVQESTDLTEIRKIIPHVWAAS